MIVQCKIISFVYFTFNPSGPDVIFERELALLVALQGESIWKGLQVDS